MRIEIQKRSSENTYNVSYIAASGKKQTSGIIGTIYPVGIHFVFVIEGKPINVLSKLSDMDGVIHNSFKIKPSYINLIF